MGFTLCSRESFFGWVLCINENFGQLAIWLNGFGPIVIGCDCVEPTSGDHIIQIIQVCSFNHSLSASLLFFFLIIALFLVFIWPKSWWRKYFQTKNRFWFFCWGPKNHPKIRKRTKTMIQKVFEKCFWTSKGSRCKLLPPYLLSEGQKSPKKQKWESKKTKKWKNRQKWK